MKVTIFKNIKDTKNAHYIKVLDVFKRIKEGNSLDLIEQIRENADKKERNKLKMQLPSICFSGIFEKRANNSIKSHTGLVAIDFDHVEDLETFKQAIAEDKYTFSCFVSPSGDGLKVIVKIPASIDTHAESCRALKTYYKNDKLDNFEDVARVCYESADADIFINKESKVFSHLEKEKKPPIKATETNYDVIFHNIVTWADKTDYYADGNKYNFIVKIAGACNRFGIPEYIATQKVIMNYQNSASYVDGADFDKIIKKVYSNYKHQNNISNFDTYKESDVKYYFEKFDKPKKEIKQSKKEKKEVSKEFLESLYNTKKIDFNKTYTAPKPIVSIVRNLNAANEFVNIEGFGVIRDLKDENEFVRLMTPGNISVFTGKAKSKKTFFQSMVAGSLNNKDAYAEMFKINIPKERPSIITFDTEQSIYDVAKVAYRVKSIAKGMIDNYHVFGLRGVDYDAINEFIKYVIYEKIQDSSIIFIDQVADLLKSINDEEEAVAVVKLLEKVTAEKNLHACCAVHQNKGNDYATGWLGSQLMKKAETVIKISKDEVNNSISYVEPDLTRGESFDSFAFKINEKGIPEILSKKEILEYDTAPPF